MTQIRVELKETHRYLLLCKLSWVLSPYYREYWLIEVCKLLVYVERFNLMYNRSRRIPYLPLYELQYYESCCLYLTARQLNLEKQFKNSRYLSSKIKVLSAKSKKKKKRIEAVRSYLSSQMILQLNIRFRSSIILFFIFHSAIYFHHSSSLTTYMILNPQDLIS